MSVTDGTGPPRQKCIIALIQYYIPPRGSVRVQE